MGELLRNRRVVCRRPHWIAVCRDNPNRQSPIAPGQAHAGDAFATPTIVYFGTVLLLSAAMNAPWHGIGGLAILLAVLGIAGVAYAIIVARRMKVQIVYTPEFEDWLFHVLLPFLAYAILGISSFAARSHVHEALFAVATAALLLFIGIHNAWDAVTYHLFVKHGREKG
jgi:hypothetical protein